MKILLLVSHVSTEIDEVYIAEAGMAAAAAVLAANRVFRETPSNAQAAAEKASPIFKSETDVCINGERNNFFSPKFGQFLNFGGNNST